MLILGGKDDGVLEMNVHVRLKFGNGMRVNLEARGGHAVYPQG